ncbi:unnamed protein product, partial [Cyprideis torosa]
MVSSKERMARCRAKRDPEAERAKNLARWHAKYSAAVAGTKTRKEKENIRKKWADQKRSQRARKKALPPSPPDTPPDGSIPRRAPVKKRTGRPKKLHLDVAKLKVKLNKVQKDRDKWKKRCERKGATSFVRTDSTQELIEQAGQGDQKARRKVMCAIIVSKALREKYQQSRTQKEKQAMRSIIGHAAPRIQKRRLSKESRSYCGGWRGKKLKRKAAVERLRQVVTSFYEQDEVSRQCAGKKETVTHKKVRKQKRFLLKDVKVLHEKFLKQHPYIPVSYSTLARLRPFWVVPMTVENRETCMRGLHANMKEMAKVLKREGVLMSTSLTEITEQNTCDPPSFQCRRGTCGKCKNIIIPEAVAISNKQIRWFRWETCKEEREIKGVTKTETKINESMPCFQILEILLPILKQLYDAKAEKMNVFRETLKEEDDLCKLLGKEKLPIPDNRIPTKTQMKELAQKIKSLQAEQVIRREKFFVILEKLNVTKKKLGESAPAPRCPEDQALSDCNIVSLSDDAFRKYEAYCAAVESEVEKQKAEIENMKERVHYLWNRMKVDDYHRRLINRQMQMSEESAIIGRIHHSLKNELQRLEEMKERNLPTMIE